MLAIKTHSGEENNHTELNIQTEVNEPLSDDHESGKKRVFNWVLLHFSNGDSDCGYSDYTAKLVQPWGLGKLLLKNNWKNLPKLKVLWMKFMQNPMSLETHLKKKKKKFNGKNSYSFPFGKIHILTHILQVVFSIFPTKWNWAVRGLEVLISDFPKWAQCKQDPSKTSRKRGTLYYLISITNKVLFCLFCFASKVEGNGSVIKLLEWKVKLE